MYQIEVDTYPTLTKNLIHLEASMSKRILKMAYKLEDWFYQVGLDVECLEVSDWINYHFVFKPSGYIQKKRLEQLSKQLSFALSTPLEHIVLTMEADKLHLSFPLDTFPIIHFNEIHNIDLKLHKKKSKANFLKVPAGIGKMGEIVYIDLNKNENWAFVGSSQQGKSSAVLALIASTLLRGDEKVKFVLIDPLKRKYRIFKKLKNCETASTIKETKLALERLCTELDTRYELNISGLNTPLIVVVDEFQQLLEIDNDFAVKLEKIASTGLEVNIKLVVSTQKLTITTSGKAKNLINNILGRVYFRIDNKRSASTLYNIGNLQSLPYPGACFIGGLRSQFGFLPDNDLELLIKKLERKQTPIEPIEKVEQKQEIEEEINYDVISNSVPREVFIYIINNCLDNERVSATSLRKYLHCAKSKALEYCKILENFGLLRSLGFQGTILTEKGKTFLHQYVNRASDYNTDYNKIISIEAKRSKI